MLSVNIGDLKTKGGDLGKVLVFSGFPVPQKEELEKGRGGGSWLREKKIVTRRWPSCMSLGLILQGVGLSLKRTGIVKGVARTGAVEKSWSKPTLGKKGSPLMGRGYHAGKRK